MQHPISFKNNKNQTLRGVVNVPKNYNSKTGTAIVILHGFPGSYRGERASKLMNFFKKNNVFSLAFDFSGSNTSDGKFEDKLMSQEVKEIKYAIDFLQKHYGFKKLILLGHSTGAIDAALYSSKDKRINKLILSGGLLHLNKSARFDFTDEQIKDFWTKGFITYTGRKKTDWQHNKKLKKAFYDEFFTLNIPKSIKKYKKPLLVIHGEKDEAVPLNSAKELFEFANKPKKLIIVKNADHSFKSKKAFKTCTTELLKFIRK